MRNNTKRLQIRSLFTSPFWWSVFAPLVVIVLFCLYSNERRFDYAGFVEKNCIVISAQELSTRSDLEDKLVAVSGTLSALDPVIADTLSPGEQFVILNCYQQRYVRKRQGKHSHKWVWETVHSTFKRCDCASLSGLNLQPKDIIAFNTSYSHDSSQGESDRVLFRGIRSPTQGTLLAKVRGNTLIPYPLDRKILRESVLFSNSSSLFHFAEGAFKDLMKFLKENRKKEVDNTRGALLFFLYIIFLFSFNSVVTTYLLQKGYALHRNGRAIQLKSAFGTFGLFILQITVPLFFVVLCYGLVYIATKLI